MTEGDIKQLVKRRWFPLLIGKMHGLPAMEQTVLFWLATQADENGVIPYVNWSALVAASGAGDTFVRKSLRPNGRLVEGGLVSRKRQSRGQGALPTEYTLLLGQ